MHLELLSYDVIKNELNRYKAEHKGRSDNFDETFIKHLEDKYNMRFFDMHKCKDNVNIRAYMQNGNGPETTTIPIIDALGHDTTMRFVQKAGKVITARARLKPSEISDKLTQAARNQICNPNEVYKNVSNVTRLLPSYAA